MQPNAFFTNTQNYQRHMTSPIHKIPLKPSEQA